MAYWELDEGDFKAGDCSKPAELFNTSFCARCNHVKKSQEVQMYGRLHADICNVPQLLITGLKVLINLTKAKPELYFLSSKENGKVYFKILEALSYVKRFRPSSSILTSHNEALLAGYPIRYNITRIEIKTYIFCWFTITLHWQCRFGAPPETLNFHNGLEHRLSCHYVYESIQVPLFRS